jgi:hypothetical protein
MAVLISCIRTSPCSPRRKLVRPTHRRPQQRCVSLPPQGCQLAGAARDGARRRARLASLGIVVILARRHAAPADRCAPSRCAREGRRLSIEEVVGADLVQSYGGAVVLADLMVRISFGPGGAPGFLAPGNTNARCWPCSVRARLWGPTSSSSVGIWTQCRFSQCRHVPVPCKSVRRCRQFLFSSECSRAERRHPLR